MISGCQRSRFRVSRTPRQKNRSEEHTSELQSPCNLVCRLLLEKKKDTDSVTILMALLSQLWISTVPRQMPVRPLDHQGTLFGRFCFMVHSCSSCHSVGITYHSC